MGAKVEEEIKGKLLFCHHHERFYTIKHLKISETLHLRKFLL